MDRLKELQQLETDMLRQFHKVCGDHGIPYFVLWGTALGAVRHKGFIPWDDDVDVGMLRSDYRKLKAVPAEEWNGLQLTDAADDCFYHSITFPRVYKPGTVFEKEFRQKYIRGSRENKRPVFLDIFLYDYVDSEAEALEKAKKAYRLQKEYYYAKYATNIVPGDSLKTKLMTRAKNLYHFFRKGSLQRIVRSYSRVVSNPSGGKYLTSFDNCSVRENMESMCSYDDLFPVREMPFGDITVTAPNHTEKLLEKWYGDYMTPPPEDKRAESESNASELVL